MAVNINIPSQVSQTITNGVTDKAPSEDAVHDALALKANSADLGATAFSNDYNDLDNLPTLNNGTVTSVDLTMPLAFSVSGNPVTSSGTLAVAAAGLSSQYIRGDGQLANFPTSSGGGSSVSYYLNGSVAQGTLGGVAFKQMSNTPVIGAGTDFTINADGYIQSFITDASVPNQLSIPGGNWNFEMYFSASSNGGTPRFYVELYKLSAGTLTLLASSSATPEFITNGIAIDLYTTALAVPSTVLLAADRLAVRVYVIHSSKTITLHTENSHLCQVITTFSTGLTALNGLTSQVQNLAVGTSGTDFAISSATNTHTFNLPTASASNRGALSTADWTTFNSKQPTLVSATNIKTVNGNSLLGSGDLVISGGGGSGIFGITNASGVYTYYATLTLAMAAATSGQTIEMFANVTETGAVTITLKNGVNINGNGYTYTLNNNGLIHAFSAANSVTTSCNINNLNVVRTGSTGTLFDNTCLILGINGSGIINCSGSTFRNLGSGAGILFNSNSLHEINYATAYATTTWGAFAMFTSAGARLNNSIGYGTSGGYGIRCHNGGDVQNCTGYSDSGYGIYGLSGNQSNSVGISTSGSGFYCAANAYNCVGRSISGIGLEITNATNAVGCVGISVSGIGISANNSLLYSCSGISSSSRGFQITGTSKAYNITSKSTSSYSILSNAAIIEIHNSTIISEWNNAGGIGISSNSTTIPSIILNSTFLLSNASAPYLFNNTAAQAVSTRGNTYRGGGAYSVLITQAIVTVEDSQGNIFL
jgi:hypothetical protein